MLATGERTDEQRLRAFGLLPAEYEHIVARLGREPNRVELGMLGAMWSEHCGYKHSRKLLKLLPTTGRRVLQGPGENAGVRRFLKSKRRRWFCRAWRASAALTTE